MKKLYFLTTLVLLCCSRMEAQTYYPLLDSLNEWSYTTHMLGVRLPENIQSGPCSYPTTAYAPSFKETTTSDTLIDSLAYKIVTAHNSMYSCTAGYIREDTAARKVYFIDNMFNPEIVLYDFSMQPGDTMTLNFFNWGSYVSGLYTLDSIGTMLTDAGMRRTFKFSCHSQPGSSIFTWVESVGSLNDVLWPFFDNMQGMGLFSGCPGEQHNSYQFLVCFYHDVRVYTDYCSLQLAVANMSQSNYVDSCDYWYFTGGIEELNSISSFEVFPNPASGKTTVRLDVVQRSQFDIIVHDISGRKTVSSLSLGTLPTGDKSVEMDLSGLTDGFYLVELRSPEGSVYRKLLIRQ